MADYNFDILKLVSSTNIADMMDDEQLDHIGLRVGADYDTDEASRSEWVRRYEQAIEVAAQVLKHRSFPWDGASNVQYPLMTIAAMNFHARAYPALVPPQNLVTGLVHGRDEDGAKRAAVERVSMHMTYQLRTQMKGWEPDMDRMLITLPITGSEFKKTYWDSDKNEVCSHWVSARDLVINYFATDIESAARKTQIVEMPKNKIIELQRKGVFAKVDLGQATPREDRIKRLQERTQGVVESGGADDDVPYMLLEWHGWLDLDGDGYKEPYVVVIEHSTRKVLRIVARYYPEDIESDGKSVLKITPVEYFTHFPFIPSPDGGFYGMGFGILLGSLNQAVNSLTNQLIDAGTLSNLQAGFVSKNLRISGGQFRFKPGEWKWVNAFGQDLRQSILPLPVRDPSEVLFKLLELLINSGQQLASATDIMVGENPGQNQKATTSMIVAENGMRVFTAVYKRVRQALGEEFKKIYAVNQRYTDPKEYFDIVDPTREELMVMSVSQADYLLSDTDIVPSADPSAVSVSQRQVRAQALLQLMPLGLNPDEVKKEILMAIDVPNKERFLNFQPPPDPQLLLDMAKQRLEERKQNWQEVVDSADMEIKAKEADIKLSDSITKRIAAQGKIVNDAKGNENDARAAANKSKETNK